MGFNKAGILLQPDLIQAESTNLFLVWDFYFTIDIKLLRDWLIDFE